MSQLKYIGQFWRAAKKADAMHRYEARFRDFPTHPWTYGMLLGFRDDGESCVFISEDKWWEECDVYDAPDAGDGYRLIDVEVDRPQIGDEYWTKFRKWEVFCDESFMVPGWMPGAVYRRRVSQDEPT